MSDKKDNWVVEQKYGIFEISQHKALYREAGLFSHRLDGWNLSAVDCLGTASTTQELHDWLEDNKENYHGSRFVILPILDVEYKIN